MAVPKAIMGATRSSGVEARVADNVSESRVVKPVVLEGPTALSKAS